MEAWGRISLNLQQIYHIRAEVNGGKGYDEADLEAEVTAFMALKRMVEQEKNGGTAK